MAEDLVRALTRSRITDLKAIRSDIYLNTPIRSGRRVRTPQIDATIEVLEKSLLENVPATPGLSQTEAFTVPDGQSNDILCKTCGLHVVHGISQRDGRTIWFHSETKQQLCYPHNPVAEPDR